MDEDRIIKIHGSFTVEEDDLGPPDLNYIPRFKTIDEWLSFIVENEKPTKPITTYNFDVFEGDETYTLCLSGTNTYNISDTLQQIKIEYSPTERYFNLPKKDYKNLTRKAVFKYLNEQFDQFISSSKFENSFFREAKFINASWRGKIWGNDLYK